MGIGHTAIGPGTTCSMSMTAAIGVYQLWVLKRIQGT